MQTPNAARNLDGRDELLLALIAAVIPVVTFGALFL